jgi:hypothetical protein
LIEVMNIHEMRASQFEQVQNWIRMSLLKGMDNHQNMGQQKFERKQEYKSIEVMNIHEMRASQFEQV